MKDLLEFLQSSEGKILMSGLGVWITGLMAKYGATVSREIGLMIDRSVEIGYYAAEQARKKTPALEPFMLKELAVRAANHSLPVIIRWLITEAHLSSSIEAFVAKTNAAKPS